MYRVGMASNKFGHKNKMGKGKGRFNGHEYASKQRSNSVFYNAYPHQDSSHKINGVQKGVFQDLEFVPALSFRHENREHVQELFDWDDDVITMLNKRRPSGCKTLSDKKHRLVCYLFESTMQMCLSPTNNLSQNPGCEAFSHVWDEGYEEINMNAYM